MWLSRDERRLLVGYCDELPMVNSLFMMSVYTAMNILGLRDDEGRSDVGSAEALRQLEANFKTDLESKEFKQKLSRVKIVNQLLRSRHLIKIDHEPLNESPHITISLTIEGHDLGNEYRTWIGRANMFYQAHKDGLLGVMWSIIGGLLGAALFHWLGLS
jgi:hypothetical protein